MISKIGALLLLTFFLQYLKAQLPQAPKPNLPEIMLPSPNAASLGIYGQIPVSLSTGLAQVSIPIENMSVDGTVTDISLGYHGGGIQPDQHPTWVGLGWDLNAGGVITRKLNGQADEILAQNWNPQTAFGYYYNPTIANNNNWYSPDTLGKYDVNPFAMFPSPDEFAFTFGGYSGSFFYDHTGHWQVRSEAPLKLKITEKLTDNFVLPKQATAFTDITVRRTFYEFDIVIPDGTEYIFGGTPNSIEFTRSSIKKADEYPPIWSTAWYLTKIITKNKREIVFNYDRGNIIIPVSTSFLSYAWNINGAAAMKSQDWDHISIINPCYLSGIISPDCQYKFFRSQSNELPFNYTITQSVTKDLDSASFYSDISKHGNSTTDIIGNMAWFKLDSICKYDAKGSYMKKYVFSYTENPSSRLMLKSIQEYSQVSAAQQPYVFSYNNIELPAYNTRETDHWGYYNHRDYLSGAGVGPNYDSSNITAYTASRAPDTSYVQAGILTAIQYPTGGKTTFEYQPNDYAKVANITFPQSTISSVSKQIGAGIRIHKINNYDVSGGLLESKEYLYVVNYNQGGTTSSGILGGVPNYLEKGSGPVMIYNSGSETWQSTGANVSYWYWYDASIEPLGYTNGSAISYSEVVEKLQDGSYTIYNYSNQDQTTYRDNPPLSSLDGGINQWKLDPTISLALDRGKLLEQKAFTSDNILIKDVKYQYDESAVRKQEAVRVVNFFSRSFSDAAGQPIPAFRISAYLIYTFPRFLTKQTNIVYDSNGQHPVTTIESFGYNRTYRQVATDTVTNSKSQTVTMQYFHPYDMNTGVYPVMTDSNMIVPVIKSVQKTNGTQSSLAIANYYVPYTGIYLPDSIQIQNGSYPLQTRITFNQYDKYGNILEQQKKGAASKEVYLWGYRGMYPVAKITGSSYTAVSAALGQTNLLKLDSAMNYTDTDIRAIFSSLRTSLPTAQIVSYTYNSPVGITSETDASGTTTYYEYDDFSRLVRTKDTNGNTLKIYDYHYKQ